MSGSESRSPRVALFIPQLAIGGSERQLLLLAQGLPREGFDPIVVTLETREGILERFESSGLAPIVLPRRVPLGLDSVWALAALTRRERVGLIHAWLFAANWRAAAARILAPSVPAIISVRSMENDLRRPHEWGYRAISPLVGKVVTNAAALAEHHRARTGFPRSRYRIIPNGIETAELDADSVRPAEELAVLPAETPIVGFVGRLAARKRVETLARIAPTVLRAVPGARFVVVGDGSSRASLAAACEAAGVSDRFLILGAKDRVGRFLARMSVFVNPGYGEGASNAILEAMAVGVPVVAYAEAGNVDTVDDGRTGWLVPDADEGALAQRVVLALTDRGRATAVGAAARAHVREGLAVAAMVRRTADLYREVLDGTGAR